MINYTKLMEDHRTIEIDPPSAEDAFTYRDLMTEISLMGPWDLDQVIVLDIPEKGYLAFGRPVGSLIEKVEEFRENGRFLTSKPLWLESKVVYR